MWVVKLGGSLAFSPQLGPWLATLCGPSARKLVVVPGGGPFADQVRAAQAARPCSDAAAHRMAILATEQFGLMLCALQPGLVPAAGRAEMEAAHAQGRVPVWMADAMTRGRADIAASWEVSADSLAAWLAAELGAELLLLVKVAEAPRGRADGLAASELARGGLVDGAFPAAIHGRGFAVRWLGPGDREGFGRAIADGPIPGVAVRDA